MPCGRRANPRSPRAGAPAARPRPEARGERSRILLGTALDAAGESEPPDAILQELGLSSVADRYPRDISSGERQRAALATVLPGMPRLVLLDEPTRGMDAGAREALVGLVARLRDQGASIVLATHDADLRAAVADRVVRVADGKVLDATPQAVHA